ncbi:DUF2786 domain-containing protein [Mycolicibacterium alvei]|uniref:DUF2786 domain-containing protein n=1 Tax=Mycolicibacterium alvei TaxID=67081 RepID=A0A6N4URD4_9MYCO|nr:DUF2786 domain-containing protein [Mycolicibacterium alvei]MCV7002208.1 DUF2786 domain-containing protein [Mycolicibacterium alvei]BBX27450.1 hypothetical protein MALV_25750 [Mycolicibacterium alvei]
MSRRNRQKRAAKHKSRRATTHQKRWHTDPEPDRVVILDQLIAGLHHYAMCPDHDAEFHAAELLDGFSGRAHDLDLAADGAMTGAINRAWEAGWSPNDLHEFARRRFDASATDYLDESVVRESQRYPATALHPRWRAELAALSARIDHGTPQMSDWADRHAVDHRAALTVVLKLLRLLGTLPILEPLLPPPGTHQHSAVAVSTADAKALSRVRGLLAKAEATKFPEEAEALSAKAQELMSRYSLHHAIRDHERGRAAEAIARRIWIDSPYVSAKAALVQSVATANRCRMVCAEKIGFVAVVGAECDLELVELLATSLLVQATRAMLRAGRETRRGGQTRTRSFRQSFLLSYATRIGERLTATSATVATEVDRGTLLPVLAARSQATDDLTNRLFPATVPREMLASSGAGWAAGRIAADRAQLDVRRPIAG